MITSYINSVCIFFLNFGHSENRFIGIRTFERRVFFLFQKILTKVQTVKTLFRLGFLE